MQLTDTRRRWPFVVLAVASAVLLVVVYLVFAKTDRGQLLDDAAFKGRKTLNPQQIKDADELLRTIDISSVALIGAAIVTVAIVRKRPQRAWAAATVIIGANVTTQILKGILDGPSLHEVTDAGKNYFPSGHATVAMSLAMAAAIVASRRTRGTVALVGSIYAAIVGVSTLSAGWHRPSDAVGAFLVVTAWAAAVLAIGPRRRPTEDERTTPVAAPVLLVGGVVMSVLAFGVLVLVFLARRSGRIHTIPLGGAYLGAACTIVALAFLVMGALLVAIRLAVPRPPRATPEPLTPSFT